MNEDAVTIANMGGVSTSAEQAQNTAPDSVGMPENKERRGFAILKDTDPGRLSEIAAKGGHHSHGGGRPAGS
jgi:general stress protein YciG